MYAVATFVIVAVLTMIFTRFATGALIATGMPPDIAAFQARSAFTGSGFTTTEAENVVNHPVRRKIASTTMVVGNLGTPTLVVTVLLGFLAPGPGDTVDRLIASVVGLIVVLLVLNAPPVTKWLVGIGQRYVGRRLLRAIGQHQELLHLDDEFVVAEVALESDPELTARSLRGLDHALQHVDLLGIRRADGSYMGAPPVDIELEVDDALVVYGSHAALSELTAGN